MASTTKRAKRTPDGSTRDERQRTARDQRIVSLHNEGYSERQIAKRVGVSRTTVWTTLQRVRADEAAA